MGLFVRVGDKIERKTMEREGFTYVADCYYQDIDIPKNKLSHPLSKESLGYMTGILGLFLEAQRELDAPSYEDKKKKYDETLASLQEEKDKVLLRQHHKNDEIEDTLSSLKTKLDKVEFKKEYASAREEIQRGYASVWRNISLTHIQERIDSLIRENKSLLFARAFEESRGQLKEKIKELMKQKDDMEKVLDVYDKLLRIIDKALRKTPSVQLFLSRDKTPLSKAIALVSFTPETLLQLQDREILTIYKS